LRPPRALSLLESERAFLEDCLEVGDLTSASRLLKVSAEALERLALRRREARAGLRLSDVACTKEARQLLREALEAVGLYARTSMAKHALKLTVPTLSQAHLEAWRRRVEEARRLISQGGVGEVSELLKRAEPKPAGLPRLSVALVLTSRGLYEKASASYAGLVDVELVSSHGEAVKVAEGHDVTLTLAGLDVDEPGVVAIAGLEDAEVVPHHVVGLYASWLPALASSLKLAELGYIKLGEAELREAKGLLEELQAALTPGHPSKLSLEEAFDWVEGELAKLKTPVTSSLLSALAEEACRRFKLSSREAEALRESLSHVSLDRPLPIPRLRLAELKEEARRREAEALFNKLRRAAHRVLRSRGLLKTLVEGLVSLDVALAIAESMKRLGLTWASIASRLGLGFIEARNLTLLLEELRGGVRVQPVSYAIGDTSIRLLGATPERLVLLTGANSGGKTTLLRTIAQLHLMTLAGLPVPAKRAEVPLARLFLIRRRTARRIGSLEYAIKRLRLIFTKPGPKVVLIDEFEALTEPGAMGRMMAALLNNMPRQALTVFVTHLPREITSNLKVPFRVDGIEARGVDERGGLIVDRQPIFNHLGSSSPELVVERLRNLVHNKRLRKLYDEMLKALKAASA